MSEIAKYIEQTILRPDTRLEDVKELCAQAGKHGFGGICIPPLYVRDTRRMLDDLSPRTRVVTVIGFPMGYAAIAAKSEEIKRATEDGADEIDAVINIAAVKSGNWNHVANDIEAMSLATNMRGKVLKLILECGLLNNEEMERLSALALKSRINWLKTGTGFHGHPATPDMVRNLIKLAPDGMKIKAAGGIRTLAEAQALIDAGAERIGTSAGVEMVTAGK
ncbi:MAG: deoxyribose-phosphate aldolase [Chitinophagales bacterium]|nr:deoxyribose-phosphate aldolase [Chitinophagales bacterium]